MRKAHTFLIELNRLLPIPPGEDCRHGLSLHPDGRFAVVVWIREAVIVPTRKGWRQFFLDAEDWERPAAELAQSIADQVRLTGGEALAEIVQTDRVFTSRNAAPKLAQRLGVTL